MELRAITADYIETINYEEEKAIFQEENCTTKFEYANKLRKNGYYANDISLEAISKKTKTIIGIYKSDERYKSNPWTIIESGINERPKGIILIHLEQGETNGTGHYSGIKLFNNHNLGNIKFNDFENANKKECNNNEDIQMMNTNQLNVLIFNCRSIREYYKKLLLIDILRSKDIDIALLQETFLIEEDKLYLD